MIAVAAMAAGAVVAGWFLGSPAATVTEAVTGHPASGAAEPLDARIAALEQALTVEREARQLLQEEVLVLSEAIADADARADSESTRRPGAAEPTAAEDPPVTPEQVRRRFSQDPEARRQRLVDNGFTIVEADRILQRESELRMETLQARYEAQRSGEPFDFRDSASTLRDELGDDAYARYLTANGRPASVTIASVYESSPAMSAGLRPGDQITRYDGQRVFSMNDIADLTLDGAAGEVITVDILRDGIAMQLSIPRGPLGVSGGRRFRPR